MVREGEIVKLSSCQSSGFLTYPTIILILSSRPIHQFFDSSLRQKNVGKLIVQKEFRMTAEINSLARRSGFFFLMLALS